MVKLNVNLTSFLNGLDQWGGSVSMMWEVFQRWQKENGASLLFSLQVEAGDDVEKYRKFIDKKGISGLITSQVQDLEQVEVLIALRPKAIILQVEDDWLQNHSGSRLYNEQLDNVAQIALQARAKKITTQVVIDPSPHRMVDVGRLGIQLVWLKATALETEEEVDRYVTCARIAVDHGIQIGIGPGFSVEQLKWILERVPHLDALMVGRQFFAESFCKGVSANLQTYMKQIRNY